MLLGILNNSNSTFLFVPLRMVDIKKCTNEPCLYQTLIKLRITFSYRNTTNNNKMKLTSSN